MNTSYTELKRHLDVLLPIWPQLQIGELTPDLQKGADLAVNGVIRWSCGPATKIGRRGIDWSGQHHGHQEWRCDLHRMAMLGALAVAWRETGDEKYPQAARDYIEDYMRAHPARDDGSWEMNAGDHPLNFSIRIGDSCSLGWLGTLSAFIGSEAFDDEFIARMLISVEAQLNYLAGHMISHGNQRVAGADTLLTAGVRLPHLSSAARWRAMGVEVLNEAARLQFLPDGAHVERSASYHSWMVNVFRHYWALGRAKPELGLEINTDLIQRAYEYWSAATRPNGEYCRINDCHRGTRSWPARAPHAAFRRQAGLADEAEPSLPSQFFPHAGQAFLRDGRDDDATYVTFEASPWWDGGHSHRGINSIQVDVKGVPLLVDPGVLDYETSNPLMAHSKSTPAHNTVNFNGWSQAPITHLNTQYSGAPGYDFLTSKYEGGYFPGRFDWSFCDGLQNGLWAAHQRLLLWAHSRYIVVVDNVRYCPSDDEPQFVECNWQFECGPIEIDEQRRQFIARRQSETGEAASLLLRVLAQPDDTRLHLREGESDPLRGWIISEKSGVVAAPQVSVRCERLTFGAAQFITLLLPFEGETPPEVEAEVVEGSQGQVLKIEAADYMDFAFLSDATFRFRREDIRFEGAAGVLHRHNNQSQMINLA